MNVLNIISSTLNKQQSTYFRKSESVISPRYQGMGLEVLQARQFSSMNRSIILDEVKSKLPNPDWEVVIRLCNGLFQTDENSKGYSKVLYAALALKEWLILHGYDGDGVEQRQELLTLARGHLEVWLLKGVAAESHHLRRSKELYTQYFKSFPESATARDQVDFCKVLLFLGEWHQAADIIVHVVTHYDHDPQISNYLFYAGVIFKSMAEYDRASTYFFEANECGPPRYFSQIEMMTVISRNLEAMNEEGEGEDNDDAYRMVHAHLLMEGMISEDTDYEDWIFDANTWLALGDKCAMHHMYSLATDFYGLGIMRDPDAFRKPMLWLRFAKACKRCGRKADALLAIKQALSRDPFNPQLNRAFRYCNEDENTRFPTLLLGDLSAILDLLPPDESPEEMVVNRLQAAVKGAIERNELRLGVGARRDKANRPMEARLGVVVQGQAMLLRVQASWMGKVTHIKVFDICKGTTSKIKLRTPFTPVRETGTPRRLVLTMQVCKYPSSKRSSRSLKALRQQEGAAEELQSESCVDVELVLKFTDSDTGRYSYRRMRLHLLDLTEAAPGNEKQVGVEELPLTEHRSLLDLPEHPSLYNTLLRNGGVGQGDALHEPSLGASVVMEGTLTSAGSPRLGVTSIAQGQERPSQERFDLATSEYRFATATVSTLEDSGPPFGVVSVTNAQTVELVKEGFQWRGLFYLVRVVNEHDVTQVTLTQLCSDRVFIFLMAREHLDRSHSLAKRWTMLLSILERNPAAKHFLQPHSGGLLVSDNFSLLDGPSELQLFNSSLSELPSFAQNNPLQLTASEHQAAVAALEAPLTILNKVVYTSLLPRGNGVSILLVDPRSRPIIGSSLEVLDNVDFVPSSLSLMRSSVAERFRSEVFPDAVASTSLSPKSLDESAAVRVGSEEEKSLGRDDSSSQLEYGSAVELVGEDDEGLGFDSSDKVAVGDDSAYELVGTAAAVGGGSARALSEEEYADMQRETVPRTQDSDMEGLRYGGALDEDSVSLLQYPHSTEWSPRPLQQPEDGSRESPQHALLAQEAPVTAVADSAEITGLRVPTAQKMHTDAERALEEVVKAIDKAGAANSVSGSTSVSAPVRPPLSTPAPAPDSRVLAARQSISLGQNLGAALTAALQAGEGKRRHSSAQQQLGVRASTANLTPQRFRKTSVKPGSVGYKAIVQVKTAAVSTVSIAMGSALLCALAAITGTDPGSDTLPVAVDAPEVSIEASLNRSLGAIQEDDSDSQDGSTAEGDWIAKLFADQDLGASGSGSLDEEEITLGTGMEQAEELAQEEPSLLFEDDQEGQEEAGDGQVPSNDRRRTRTMTSATSASSGTSGFDLNEDDTESATAAAALAAQVDIEWIVELGSSGAMEQFEETLLEELFEQGVQHWAEVVSDQIPVVRIPLLQSALKEGTESAQQVFVYSSEILDRELAREVEFQAMCVTLVQVGEAVAVRRAIKSILATEKARELARRRLANEERAKQAALKAAQEQQAAAVAATQTPVTVETKTPYRPIVVSESEEFLSALGGKGGYFVKKIRSQVYDGASETAASPGKHQHPVPGRPRPHTTSSSSSLVAGMKRLVAMRDTFTPELPPSLQDGTTRHRHVDHLQQTALSGGISLSAVPSSPHTPPSSLIPAGFDNGDAMFSQSMVPLHITENSAEKPAQFGAAWEASELSLNNYFQLDQEPAQSPSKQTIPLAGTSRRSAAEVSKLKRQVNHSRRAQNRNCPTDGEPPLWVSVGGANSASLLLPQRDPAATVPAFTATADSATFAPDQSSAFANTIGTLPFPTAKDTFSSATMPIISMLHSRAQSPAFPAAALPNYAFDSAEGLKRALQDNWTQQTIPRYWGSALKERADERINQPFAVKSANTRKQRRVIKAKSAFAAAAATQAMNSTAEQREQLDRQFTLMMEDDEEVHESFFESHIGPFGLRDLPFQQTERRHQSEQAGGGSGAPQLAASSSSKTTGMRSDAETEPRYAVRPQTAPDTGPRSERRDSLDQSDLGSEGYSFFNSLADAEAAQQEQQQRKQRSRARSGGDLSRRSQAFEFSFDAAAEKAAQNLAETAPLVHSVRKGLQHDHAFDDSILLSNQVEPPFHHLSTRIACRSPADMAVHFKRSTAAIAEQIDQAVEREQVDEMFRKSLEIFHKVGYVQKRPLPHATHWVKVVSHYLASLQSIDELRKRLSTLQRASPRGLTTEEAVCALSDVKGSVGQAVEKLKHPEYFAEVRLVCRSIQVRNMVLLLEGGEQVYNYRVGEAAGLTGQSTKVSWEDAPILVNRHGEWVEAKRPGSSEAKRPGSSMFVGMDEEALKAATLVTNPYGASIAEQHREVVAHRKIREHYDEITGTASGSFSASDPNSSIQPSGRSGKISRQSIRQSIRASFTSLGGISEASEGQVTADEAAQTVGSDGLFVAAGKQSKLRHDSRYVLSRASLITLQAQNSAAVNNHTQGTTGAAEPTTGLPATKLVPSMARAGLRGSLAMSVSSPKKTSMLLNNVSYAGYDPSAGGGNSRAGGGKYSVTSGAQVGNSSFNLLDAIAAAVAAADGSLETGPVQDHGGSLAREREEAELRHLHGSISVSTTGRPSQRSSLRMSQRAWRLNSGIFDPQTPKSTSSAATPTSKRNSLKLSMRSMGQLARLSPGRKPPSPPKSPTTPTTPKFKLRTDGGQFFLEEELPDEAAVRPATTGTLQLRASLQTDGSLEEGIDEEEGNSGSEEEEQPPVTPPTPAPRAHVSINPWYLKQQQGANTRTTTTLTSSQPGTPKTPKTPTATSAETFPQKPQTAPAMAPLQSFRGMPAPMVREKSYRTENIVDEIFEREALGVPFAVMSRRDAERATKDETLARSNKQYIRQSIELRALKYQHG